MKKTMLLLYSLVLCGGLQAKNLPSLKDVLGKYFMVGTAVNVEQVNGNEPKAMEIIQSQFNSVVAENCMKPENIEPQEVPIQMLFLDRKYRPQYFQDFIVWLKDILKQKLLILENL